MDPLTTCGVEKVEGCTTSETLVTDRNRLVGDVIATIAASSIYTVGKISIRKKS